MEVIVPGPLLSYTRKRRVEAVGTTLGALLEDLDRQFPGLRFRVIDEQDRVRQHMRFFVNGARVQALSAPLGPGDTLQIVQALSGG